MSQAFSLVEVMAAREMARQDLYFFNRWMFLHRKGFAWQRARQHRVICDALTRVFLGDCKRLIINVPPRYSKTELVKGFVAWGTGHAPDAEWIYTSYSGRLAAASSWDVRGAVREPEYQAIFPGVSLRNDSQAKDEWRTTSGGIVYAVGAGGTITGYGAGKHRPGFSGALIVDDPHKADEARSDVIRQGVIDWFQNTLESRKNSPDTPVIVIMQRLHESDLAGWLLGDRGVDMQGPPVAGGNGEAWEHVRLDVWQRDEQGREVPLWPEKHSAEDLRRMECASPYVFAGQYRQRPAPLDGGLFKPHMIQTIDTAPAGTHWCRGWDFGATTDGDPTAGALIGRAPDGRFVIGGMEWGRWGPDERDACLVNTARRDGRGVRISIPQDPGQAGKTQGIYLTRQLAGYRVTCTPETGDKVTRAEPFAAQVNVGNVLMVRGDYSQRLMDEMRVFPNGTHDDQVDSCGRAFAEVMQPVRLQINQAAIDKAMSSR